MAEQENGVPDAVATRAEARYRRLRRKSSWEACGAVALALWGVGAGSPGFLAPAGFLALLAWGHSPRSPRHALDVPAFDLPPEARLDPSRLRSRDGLYHLGRTGVREAWASLLRMGQGLVVVGPRDAVIGRMLDVALQHVSLGGGLTWVCSPDGRCMAGRVAHLADKVGRGAHVLPVDPGVERFRSGLGGLDLRAFDAAWVTDAVATHCVRPHVADPVVAAGAVRLAACLAAVASERRQAAFDVRALSSFRVLATGFAGGSAAAAADYVALLPPPREGGWEDAEAAHAIVLDALRGVAPFLVEPYLDAFGMAASDFAEGPEHARLSRVVVCRGVPGVPGLQGVVAALSAASAADSHLTFRPGGMPHMVVVEDAASGGAALVRALLRERDVLAMVGCRDPATGGVPPDVVRCLEDVPTRIVHAPLPRAGVVSRLRGIVRHAAGLGPGILVAERAGRHVAFPLDSPPRDVSVTWPLVTPDRHRIQDPGPVVPRPPDHDLGFVTAFVDALKAMPPDENVVVPFGPRPPRSRG